MEGHRYDLSTKDVEAISSQQQMAESCPRLRLWKSVTRRHYHRTDTDYVSLDH